LYSTCPACQTVLTLEDVNSGETASKEPLEGSFLAPQFLGSFSESESFDISDATAMTSSKLEMLVKQLIEFRQLDPTFKCVVFSQWTGMLKMVSRRLDQANFKWVLLDGQMSRNARTKAMQDFASDKSIRVFLASLTAGNLGINLTSANKAILLDPWWNPATENRNQTVLCISPHFSLQRQLIVFIELVKSAMFRFIST
jgi:SNF2 family DNA or RNA helicase